MKKTSKSISITLILAIMLLACLLLNAMGQAGAWFTAGGAKVKINLTITGAEVFVYQNSVSNVLNANPKENEEANYISLSGIIEPEVEIPLALGLKSNDAGSFYLRYKFQVIANGVQDKELTVERLGIVKPSSSKNGFVIDSGDGYYYYQNSSSVYQKFSKNDWADGIILLTGFKISTQEWMDKSLNGQTIKILLTVECSDIAWNTTT